MQLVAINLFKSVQFSSVRFSSCTVNKLLHVLKPRTERTSSNQSDRERPSRQCYKALLLDIPAITGSMLNQNSSLFDDLACFSINRWKSYYGHSIGNKKMQCRAILITTRSFYRMKSKIGYTCSTYQSKCELHRKSRKWYVTPFHKPLQRTRGTTANKEATHRYWSIPRQF